MKVALISVLLLFACAGCRKPVDHDITIWLMPNNSSLSIEISYARLTERTLDRILQTATEQHDGIGLVVCLPPGVSITNAFSILTMAERHGITNTVVRTNQIRPPPSIKRDEAIFPDL